MLDPVHPLGAKPSFFMVHGAPGFMPLGPALAEVLGSDRPVYAIHARGTDGKEPPLRSIREMALTYVTEIRSARPSGPYVIGGMCIGGLIALEIARELTDCGERVGTVLLLDPPPLTRQWVTPLGDISPDDPKAYRQLHRYLTDFLKAMTRHWPNVPFDIDDQRQLHNAVKVAITNSVAAHAHVPVPYAGAVELVICEQRASGYFHPASPWRKLLEHPAKVHVLPGGHTDIFNRHSASTCRLIAFGLEGAFDP
jgi:thioesterase domain-containing protein